MGVLKFKLPHPCGLLISAAQRVLPVCRRQYRVMFWGQNTAFCQHGPIKAFAFSGVYLNTVWQVEQCTDGCAKALKKTPGLLLHKRKPAFLQR